MNVNRATLDAKAMGAYAENAGKLTGGATVEFLMKLIPTTVVDAFAKGDVLQVPLFALLFALLFGSALALVGARGKAVAAFVDDVARALQDHGPDHPARAARHTRRDLEAGLVCRRAIARAGPRSIQLQARGFVEVRTLRQHVKDEQAAIDGADAATRTFLRSDFHVCLAECLGHRMPGDLLRDLTARTTLFSWLYQSSRDARQPCAHHGLIVNAAAAGDAEVAARLMAAHIGTVEHALGNAAVAVDPRERLRASLAPLRTALPTTSA